MNKLIEATVQTVDKTLDFLAEAGMPMSREVRLVTKAMTVFAMVIMIYHHKCGG
jgi:hypothetical protein